MTMERDKDKEPKYRLNYVNTDENYLGTTLIELANKILESYGFSKELRFRPVCEKCTRFTTEDDISL